MALLSSLAGFFVFAVVMQAAGPAWAQSSSRPQAAARLPSAAAIAARTAPRGDDVWEDEQPRPRAVSPTFRTLCVRLCDGFYFPVSFQTSRRGLAVDAARCQAKCGTGAQLFFHANPGGDVASARSFTGLQYESLPNAFRHLKMRVPGCGCTPDPWSTAEQERHHGYAETERAELDAKAAALQMQEPKAPASEGVRPLAALRRGATDDAVGEPRDAAVADVQVAPAPIAQPPPRRLDLRGGIARN